MRRIRCPTLFRRFLSFSRLRFRFGPCPPVFTRNSCTWRALEYGTVETTTMKKQKLFLGRRFLHRTKYAVLRSQWTKSCDTTWSFMTLNAIMATIGWVADMRVFWFWFFLVFSELLFAQSLRWQLPAREIHSRLKKVYVVGIVGFKLFRFCVGKQFINTHCRMSRKIKIYGCVGIQVD